MDADLDTLATALYVTADDLLKAHSDRAPHRPPTGIAPRITDAELITLAVLQALGGFTSEARWLRHAGVHLRHLFPHQPQQPGYNKRLRALTDTMAWLIGVLAADTTIAGDDVWLVDSTPVECARSRETVKRSALVGWAQYGYCASHSRYFWGLRLHLVATVHGLPVGWALTGAKADERVVLTEILTGTPGLTDAHRSRQLVIADKNYYGKAFETELEEAGLELLRPARAGEAPRPGARFFKPLRQIIESVNNTLKAHLDLERHGGRTVRGVCARIAQRLLALTTAIWHNDRLGTGVRRSLTAYDH
ncbi:transposase [Kocuria rosea subsp. polaris]|uniref:Transposase n=1 Tax=Kocuria rosea subsp. polaris TaxID=136273 RepID=A0A0W8IBF6_KOCRO|nr:IS982 family transposase [Kocuria polaris]KUG57269.1 transposase [Kocuria polaris]